jgi:hypothetical protein
MWDCGRNHGSERVFSAVDLCHLYRAQKPIGGLPPSQVSGAVTGWNDCNFVALGD